MYLIIWQFHKKYCLVWLQWDGEGGGGINFTMKVQACENGVKASRTCNDGDIFAKEHHVYHIANNFLQI